MSIYQSLYDLIAQYVYGGVELTTHMDLVCVLVATLGCLFLVAMPFVIVYLVIKLITGGLR